MDEHVTRCRVRIVGSWIMQTKVRKFSVVGLTVWAGMRLTTSAVHAKTTERTAAGSNLPFITLYQYETCPFCCRMRTFLDYYGIQYRKVEVNPIFKREIKFSTYKKLPITIAGDNIQMNDSSLMISVLRTAMLYDGDVGKALEMYPEITTIDDKGKPVTERVNKHSVMYGNTDDLKCRREEREWRQWVDDKLVHKLAPNIYKTPRQSLQAFRYITEISNFSTFERYMAKYVGAVMMYFIAKKVRVRYEIQIDVRQAMYDDVDQWMKAIGKKRKFLGGDQPNLADLAVYSVLRATEGLDTFDDVMSNTDALPWYRNVQDHVTHHRGALSTSS